MVVSLELRKLRAQRGGGSSRPCGSQKSCPGLPLGLLGFLARGAREPSCCAPVVYRCSPQLLLDREPGRGAHTGCRGGAPTTLGPEHLAPPNSLRAVMGPLEWAAAMGSGWAGEVCCPGALWGHLGTPRLALLRPTFQQPQSPSFSGDG